MRRTIASIDVDPVPQIVVAFVPNYKHVPLPRFHLPSSRLLLWASLWTPLAHIDSDLHVRSYVHACAHVHTMAARLQSTLRTTSPPAVRSSTQDGRSMRNVFASIHAAAAPAAVVSTEDPKVHIRYGISSTQGPRETMEDVAYAVPSGPCGLFYCSVLDGHAGVASARYLEEHLFDTIYQAFKEDAQNSACAVENLDEEGLCCPIGLTSIMTSSYQQADAKLLRWLKKQPGPEKDSGSTATSVLVDQNRIVVANVGDSRAVLSRTSGHVDLSVEHRVYGSGDVVAREAKRVEASGGWVDDGRVCGILAVSRAFGDAAFKGEGLNKMLEDGVRDGYFTAESVRDVSFVGDPVISLPDVLEMSVSPEDEFVIVATDGLWDVVTSKEGCDFVRRDMKKGQSPEQAAERLITIAERRRTQDNVAVVVIDLKGADWWQQDSTSAGGKKIFGLF